MDVQLRLGPAAQRLLRDGRSPPRRHHHSEHAARFPDRVPGIHLPTHAVGDVRRRGGQQVCETVIERGHGVAHRSAPGHVDGTLVHEHAQPCHGAPKIAKRAPAALP